MKDVGGSATLGCSHLSVTGLKAGLLDRVGQLACPLSEKHFSHNLSFFADLRKMGINIFPAHEFSIFHQSLIACLIHNAWKANPVQISKACFSD